MAIDPNIKKKADDIRNKVYGKEVRESLASGLEEMSSDVVENEGRQSVVEGRQDSVESQWQVVSDEMTDKDVISAPEIIAARNGEPNLKARLDKEKNEVTAQLDQTEQELSSQLAQIVYPKEYLNERFANGQSVRIKLIGDSITAGQGATGYEVSESNPVIFTDHNGTTRYEANTDSASWANKFRDYILSVNPNNEFTNWGVGGVSTTWWRQNLQHIQNEDVVFVNLGTNDRNGTLAYFEENIRAVLSHVKNNSNYVVAIIPHPLVSGVETLNFTNADVERITKKVAEELSIPTVNMYEKFTEYSRIYAQYTDLIPDGIHLNDGGHQYYWDAIQEEAFLFDIRDQENKHVNHKVVPASFDNYAKAYDNRSHVIATNMITDPLMGDWTDGELTGTTKTAGCVSERIPSIFKGQYAIKLTSVGSSGSYRFPFSYNNTKENSKLLVAYESFGVCRFDIFQPPATTPIFRVFLPEGRHNLILDLPFDTNNQALFYARVHPNVTLRDGGYTTIDTMVAVTNESSKHGFFTDANGVNPEWFDIHGDGTNENSKFQAMMNHLGVATTDEGYKIILNKGDYNVGSIANTNKRVVVEGQGYASNISTKIPNTIYKDVAVDGVITNDIYVRKGDGSQGRLLFYADNTIELVDA